MNYLIVSGSARPNGQSLRIASWLERQFPDQDETVVLDLSEAYIPWDTSALWDKDGEDTHQFAPTRHYLEWCDALIIVSPEWHGMAPGKVISFFQAASEGRLIAHKPGLIVCESDARGGAFPEAMIRGFTAKNSRINWIPEHLLIRFNHDMFLENPVRDDEYIQKRARYCVDLLRHYTETLAPARQILLEGIENFPNGM